MSSVKPKKHLGQHFLKDQDIARNISEAVSRHNGYSTLLEIGPGTGVLTQFLKERHDLQLKVVEIDQASVEYLLKQGLISPAQLAGGDFLKMNLAEEFPAPFGIIGNFPYNISSQIFFRVYEHRDRVQEVVCMVQKEVGQRVAAGPGSKTNGILSILLQAFYEVSYEFTVPPSVFYPPPKVESAVITLRRNNVERLPCDEKLFFRVVKQGYNMRRKTLRNALKPIQPTQEALDSEYMSKRAEQLSVNDFIKLSQLMEKK